MLDTAVHYQYDLVEGTYMIDNDAHTGYGIRVAAYAETEAPLCFADLIIDRNAALELVMLCNTLQISPIHLGEVVCDFLCEH